MMSQNPVSCFSAISDFHQLRRKAVLENIMPKLTGHSVDLLSYQDVRKKLREIPLDTIVGSVGRYTDFICSFSRRWDSDEGRWAGVRVAVTDLGGLPPI